MPPKVVRVRADLTWYVLAAVPGLTVIVMATTKFGNAARTPDGAAAGAILIVVGCVVGRVLAGEKIRPLGIFLSSSLAIVMCWKWIDHPGSERTLFAFCCACAGVLMGACSPLRRDYQDDEVIDVEALPSPLDETTLRS